MPTQIQCSSCKTLLQCQDAMIAQMRAGQRFQCPVCKTPLAAAPVAPAVPELTPPAPAATDTGTAILFTRSAPPPPQTPAPAPKTTEPAPAPAKPQAVATAKPQSAAKSPVTAKHAPARAAAPASKAKAPPTKPQVKPVATPPPAKAVAPARKVQPPLPAAKLAIPTATTAAPPPRPRRGSRKLAFLFLGSFLVVVVCVAATAAILAYMLLWKPTPPPVTVKDYGRFGVIEIGTQGIKSFVVEEYATEDKETDFRFRKIYTAENVDPGSMVVSGVLNDDLFNQVTARVRSTVETMRSEHEVTDERTYVVFSSGFDKQFNGDKELETKVKGDLSRQLIAALHWPDKQQANIETMDEFNEARYGAYIIVPRKDHPRGLYLDLGSGNLKGGYFDQDNRFQRFSTRSFLGTKKFAEHIAAHLEGQSFLEASARHGKELKGQFDQTLAETPEMSRRDRVFLNGGSPWVMTICTHPDKGPKDRYVPITSEDIAVFRQMVLAARVEVDNPDLSPKDRAKQEAARSLKKLREAVLQSKKLEGASAEHLEWLNKDFDTVNFSNDALIAGSEILLALDAALELKNKGVYFYRDGHLAWSLGFVNAKVQARAKAAR